MRREGGLIGIYNSSELINSKEGGRRGFARTKTGLKT
jgi:hypothetical protein